MSFISAVVTLTHEQLVEEKKLLDDEVSDQSKGGKLHSEISVCRLPKICWNVAKFDDAFLRNFD